MRLRVTIVDFVFRLVAYWMDIPWCLVGILHSLSHRAARQPELVAYTLVIKSLLATFLNANYISCLPTLQQGLRALLISSVRIVRIIGYLIEEQCPRSIIVTIPVRCPHLFDAMLHLSSYCSASYGCQTN
jgi:hypothetical protein